MKDKVPKIKIVSVNFRCAVFSLLDFLTLEAGITILCCIISRRVQISHDDWVPQALVWLCVVRFTAIWFGAVQCFVREFKTTLHI